MLFVDKMHNLISTLESDGIILIPTDCAWMLAGSLKSKEAYMKIKSLTADAPTVLCDDLSMLKYHLPKLHPRIETLLIYHSKPLTLLERHYRGIPAYVQAQHTTIPFHLQRDNFTRQIIHLLGNALCSVLIKDSDGNSQIPFDAIPTKYLDAADYIARHNRAFVPLTSTVQATYDDDGQLHFY